MSTIRSSASFTPYERAELGQSIPDRFEKIVTSCCDRNAVQSGTSIFTYDELNRSANRLAHALLQRSEKIEEPVGLIVEDECLAVAAILGVLKAGKFYVPLDRSFPVAKLSSINVSHLEEKFLVFLRLIIWVRPGEKLISIVFEMHRDLTEDPPAQVDSVIKILRRSESDFRLLDITRVEIYWAIYRLVQRDQFLLEPICLPLDFG